MNETDLSMSHIVPKMFYDYIKSNSLTGGMRMTITPNRRVEDGLKLRFLCKECEKTFNEFETYFANKFYYPFTNDSHAVIESDDDKLRYFILSMAWRCLQYDFEFDKEMLEDFTDNEIIILRNTLNQWRIWLLNKDFNSIKEVTSYMIPTLGISMPSYTSDRMAGHDFKIWDVGGKKETFDYAVVYVRVPFFIFLTVVWGSRKTMGKYRVGRKIRSGAGDISKELRFIIEAHQKNFLVSKEKISEKQIQSIMEKVARRIIG